MIRHPNTHTDAKGYRLSDEMTFLYEEGETRKGSDTTIGVTTQSILVIYVTSAIEFEIDDKLILPNKSNDAFVVQSIPKSKPKYNKRRGKRGSAGKQIREWELELRGR